jgi:hypothetical protein
MERQCSRGHNSTEPGEVADDTLARHITAPAHDSTQGEAGQLGEKLEVAIAETLGYEEAINEISQTGRCTVTRSTRCTPSRRLTPAGMAGIEGAATTAIQSREPKREEEKGGESTGRVGERPSHLVGLDQVGWCLTGGPAARQVGQGQQLGQEGVLTKK